MTANEFQKPTHTLSRLNKTLCSLLVIIMVVMLLSYYITTVMEVKLTKLSGETMKLNNENVELQNRLDNLMSYNNVEALVRKSGMLDAARQVIEISDINYVPKKKPPINHDERNYYRWSLGF